MNKVPPECFEILEAGKAEGIALAYRIVTNAMQDPTLQGLRGGAPGWALDQVRHRLNLQYRVITGEDINAGGAEDREADG